MPANSAAVLAKSLFLMECSSLVTFRARAAKLPRLVSKTTEHDAPFPQFAHFARRACTNLIRAGRNTKNDQPIGTSIGRFRLSRAAPPQSAAADPE